MVGFGGRNNSAFKTSCKFLENTKPGIVINATFLPKEGIWEFVHGGRGIPCMAQTTI